MLEKNGLELFKLSGYRAGLVYWVKYEFCKFEWWDRSLHPAPIILSIKVQDECNIEKYGLL